MGREIERKFLLKGSCEYQNSPSKLIKQGYLVNEKNLTLRIRTCDGRGFLTIKTPTDHLIQRDEFEYEVPLEDSNQLLAKCNKFIEKRRYLYHYKGNLWEIDHFLRENEGLVVAEIELTSIDEYFEKPSFIDMEVTDDPKYLNSKLIEKPYKHWSS